MRIRFAFHDTQQQFPLLLSAEVYELLSGRVLRAGSKVRLVGTIDYPLPGTAHENITVLFWSERRRMTVDIRGNQLRYWRTRP